MVSVRKMSIKILKNLIYHHQVFHRHKLKSFLVFQFPFKELWRFGLELKTEIRVSQEKMKNSPLWMLFYLFIPLSQLWNNHLSNWSSQIASKMAALSLRKGGKKILGLKIIKKYIKLAWEVNWTGLIRLFY